MARNNCSSRERNCTCDSSLPNTGMSIGAQLRDSERDSENDSLSLDELDAKSLEDRLVESGSSSTSSSKKFSVPPDPEPVASPDCLPRARPEEVLSVKLSRYSSRYSMTFVE